MVLDREYVSHQLDAMKMAQSTLQQLMTLSAGGLALFFGFIGKAEFLASVQLFGVGVVTAWIASLCAAAYAHRIHSGLFASLIHLHAVVKAVSDLDSMPDEVEAELKKNPNAQAVVQRAKEKLTSEHERLKRAFREFESSFFPQQDRAFRAMRVSLYMLVLGFIELGVGYVISPYITQQIGQPLIRRRDERLSLNGVGLAVRWCSSSEKR